MRILELLNLNPDSFGLEIADLCLRLVKIRKKGNKYKMDYWAKKELPQEIIKRGEIRDIEKLAENIKKFISQEKKIKTKRVAVSLPEEKSFCQVIRLPHMGEEELKSAAKNEAERYIPFPREKVYLDVEIITPFKDVKKSKNFSEVLLVAVPKTTVDSYFYVIKKAGLTPVLFETESQSISRAVIAAGKTTPPVLIINIYQTRTILTLFDGNSIRFTAPIMFSENLLNQKIAQAMNIDIKKAQELKNKNGIKNKTTEGGKFFEIIFPILDEFKNQIKKYIDYYNTHVIHSSLPQNESSIKKIILSGSGAKMARLKEFIQENIGIPTLLANPLINIETEKSKIFSKKEDFLEYSTAIGLAMCAANIHNYD